MTPARARVLEVAGNGMTWAKSALAEAAGVSTGVIDGLVDAGTLITEELPAWAPPPLDLSTARARLTPEQADAAAELLANMNDGFSVTLLDGVTGSGKTEVYFEAIAATLAQGKQALVLMPEIALTGHFIARCEQRFGAKPAEWHSGLSARLRGRVWRAVAENQRSSWSALARRCSCPSPISASSSSMRSMTQATSRRSASTYQARDMAVLRGSLGQFPVVLSLGHALDREPGECEPRPLPAHQARAALQGRAPSRHRGHRHAADPPERGKWLSPVLVEAVAETLARGEQALLFLNRRGYAPVTVCRTAVSNSSARIAPPGWSSTAFAGGSNAIIAAPSRRSRGLPELRRRAFARALRARYRAHRRGGRERFPEARRVLLERPTPGVSDLRETLREIEDREVDIVIGTQLVAKGHHFPGLHWSAWSTRSRPSPCRPARRRAHLPASQSGDRARRPRSFPAAG